MKKTLLTTFVLAVATVGTVKAQFVSNDYYRVQNYGSDRYIYLTDNTGSYDMARDQGDLGAVQLWSWDSRNPLTDPSSLVYIRQYSASQFDLEGQGISLYGLTGHYVNVRETQKNSGIYQVYATKSGVTKNLGDSETSDSPDGTFSTSAKADNILWHVHKVSSSSDDNYFGISPIVTVGKKHYFPLYMTIPFTLRGDMKAYTVTSVGRGMAVLTEVMGVIPGFTPVILECSSTNPADNKVDLVAPADMAPLRGNKLNGSLFSNESRVTLSKAAVTKFDATTMRMLGVTSEGKLGFISTSDQLVYFKRKIDGQPLGYCLPANQAFLPVEAGSPEEITIVSQKEYDDAMSSIDGVRADNKDQHAYDLRGVLINKDTHRGVYVQGGKTYVK